MQQATWKHRRTVVRQCCRIGVGRNRKHAAASTHARTQRHHCDAVAIAASTSESAADQPAARAHANMQSCCVPHECALWTQRCACSSGGQRGINRIARPAGVTGGTWIHSLHVNLIACHSTCLSYLPLHRMLTALGRRRARPSCAAHWWACMAWQTKSIASGAWDLSFEATRSGKCGS